MDPICEKYRVDPHDFTKDKDKREIDSGYGSVSFCIQNSTNVRCVLKKTKETLTLERVERSFNREVETLVKCVHPAIIPFIGFAIVQNIGYIYLVEAKNGSLQTFLEKSRKGTRDPRFNNTIKFIISYGVAKTMEFLHSDNRIHRDIKPGNILLDENFHPLLTDFGTAKQIDQSVKINQTLQGSTPTIMAPEFIEDSERFSNSLPIDVYSYGMTLYELWTELAPFSHLKTPFQVLSAITAGQRPSIPSSVPKVWKDLIELCWSDNPDVRPTFQAIVQDFETGNYYTDDMDREEIEAYKASISIDAKNEPQMKPELVVETESEPEPEPEIVETENPVLTKMRQDAVDGDTVAQFNLVVALVDGTYGKFDYNEAKEFAKKYNMREGAYEKPNLENTATIEYYSGRCYANDEDYVSAARILKKSVSHGCPDAAFFLAELMFNQNVKNCKGTEIQNYYKIAANGGVAAAVKKYAKIVYYGTFTGRPDKEESIRYIEMGSDQGDPELMHAWAVRLEFGRGVEKDVAKAMNLMKLAAEKGYTPAMVNYGIHLLNGINVPINETEAKVRFQTAASKGDPWGQLWYYVMCKNTALLDSANPDESIGDNLTDSLNSNEVPDAWSIYGREIFDSGNIDDALPCLFFAAANGSIDAYLCLGEICEENPTYGHPKTYFEIASYLCHALDVCGFTTPIQYQIFRCNDCGVNVCEGCAKHCHDGHDVNYIDTQMGFKCECGKDGFKGKCTSEFIGETRAEQHVFQCATCCFKDDTRYICKSCAENCHKDHVIIDCGVMKEYCSCGMHKLPYNFNCHLLKFNHCDGCSCTKQKQRWFQCLSCGLYGSDDVGICQQCAKICHETHNILDRGVKDACCSCKNASCVLLGD